MVMFAKRVEIENTVIFLAAAKAGQRLFKAVD